MVVTTSRWDYVSCLATIITITTSDIIVVRLWSLPSRYILNFTIMFSLWSRKGDQSSGSNNKILTTTHPFSSHNHSLIPWPEHCRITIAPDDKTLLFDELRLADQGVYICEGENSIGNARAMAQVSVICK